MVRFLMISIIYSQPKDLDTVPFLENTVTQFPNVRDIALTSNENEIVFSAQSVMGDVSALVYVKISEEVWSTPEVLSFSGQYFDLEPYLTERSADGASLMSFYHPTTFGEKVKEEYLSGITKTQRHQGLAEYFTNLKLYVEGDDDKKPNLRKLSELPFQQTYL